MEKSGQISFGEMLKASRKMRGMTQQQLARKLAMHPNTIGAWEWGDYLPATRGMILELARCLRLNHVETHNLLDAGLTSVATPSRILCKRYAGSAWQRSSTQNTRWCLAEWLNLSVPAVNSSLQRARRALQEGNMLPEIPDVLPTLQLQSLLGRYVILWEQADIPGLVGLLREDAWFTMPPIPAWFQGRADIATLLQTSILTAARQWRLLPTYANASPAFGLYLWEAEAGVYQFFGLIVLGIVGEQIASLVAFLDLSCLSCFALPPHLAP